MENYHGVVQNIVMIGDGEYRVTFRAYNEKDVEATFRENEDVPFKLYTMITRRMDNDLSLIPEGILSDCLNILRDNDKIETVQFDEIDKWKIGLLASDIAFSLAEGGMLTVCGEEENG